MPARAHQPGGGRMKRETRLPTRPAGKLSDGGNLTGSPACGHTPINAFLAPRVQVLLACYNGAPYLAEQLESLAAQEDVEWSLLWRDDGSTDATVAMLNAFATRHPGRVACLPYDGRLGAGASFMRLLAEAPEAPFYAFMDQDDVWLSSKLARGVARLDSADITCSRLRLVTPELRAIGLSAMPSRQPVFATLLAHNVAAGCTMVMTARARQWALAAPLPEGELHDWWCALAVTGCGGRLVFDAEPSLLYRQHAGNLVGGGTTLAGRGRRMLGRGAASFYTSLARFMAALPVLPLTGDARAVLREAEGLRAASPLRRLAALRRSGLAHHTRLGQLLLSLWVAQARLR